MATATISALAAEGIPVTSHVGLIPSKCTWIGGFKAVGKTSKSALDVWNHVKKLEEVGCFAAELEVVSDRVAAEISKRASLIMLSMGAGAGGDGQCGGFLRIGRLNGRVVINDRWRIPCPAYSRLFQLNMWQGAVYRVRVQ